MSSPRIGRYDLITGIGRGGMSDVFLAIYSNGDEGAFQKLLVLKLLRAELGALPEFVQMFTDEARLAARLNHPNVVQTLEVGVHSGRHFLAMEYVEGQPLNRVIQSLIHHPGFDLSARLTIMQRMLAGLDYAHGLLDYSGTPLGIVHRDVSPGNLLIGYDGAIKLTDFGIAKANDSSSQTRVGIFKGKVAYMAPEQALPGRVDRRADIYSAGVVLWELIVGRRMWGGVSETEIFRSVAAAEIPSPIKVVPNIPPELDRICRNALAFRREDRYATAELFAADIEAFVQQHLAPRSEREVGALVAEAFAEKREQVRRIVEQRLSGRGPGGPPVKQSAEGAPSPASSRGDAGEHFTPSVSRSRPLSSTTPSNPGGLSVAKARGEFGKAISPLTLKIAGGVALAALVGVLSFESGDTPSATEAVTQPQNSLAAAAASPSTQRGVSATEVTLGMSGVFSGPNRQLGENMKLGLETAFWVANSEGGVHGRRLALNALDDGYESSAVAGTMRELLEQRRVFAVIGNIGTPTSAVAAPIASKQKTLFFGAFSGAPVLRQEPPERYVFNYRASYREETAESVRYLVRARKIPLEQIVVMAQEDSFGDAGYAGVLRAARQLDATAPEVLRTGYARNTTDVDGAVAQILRYHEEMGVVREMTPTGVETRRVPKHPVRAVIMIATYRPAAKFIQKLRQTRIGKVPVFNVSFVGTEALADDLRTLGQELCEDVYITQVVPHPHSGASGVRRYRDALAAYQPQAQPGFISLEGFVVGALFVEALKRTGPELSTERLVDVLEHLENVDLGFGQSMKFALSEHQASHKVWGTRLGADCTPESVELE